MYVSEIQERKRKIFIRNILVTGILLIFAGIFIFRKPNDSANTILSPVPSVMPLSRSVNAHKVDEDKKSTAQLLTTIKKIAEENAGLINYSILFRPIGGNSIIDIHSDTVFPAASVNKLPVLFGLYTLVNTQEVDLNTRITVQESDIQDYGTGIIRYQGAGNAYQLRTLAEIMIQKSDNTAGYILYNHIVGVPRMEELLQKWSLNHTNLILNETSNSDMYVLLEKIYTGAITSPGQSKEMLSFLKKTDFEDRIPALLPETTNVYHKIGNGERVMHDVGIVEISGKTPYYLGIFTNDIVDDTKTTTAMQMISKAIYDYVTVSPTP